MTEDGLNWIWVMPTEPFDPEVPWGHQPPHDPKTGGWLVHDGEEHFPGDLRGFLWSERLKMGATHNAHEHLDLLMVVLDALHADGPEPVPATVVRSVIGHEGY